MISKNIFDDLFTDYRDVDALDELTTFVDLSGSICEAPGFYLHSLNKHSPYTQPHINYTHQISSSPELSENVFFKQYPIVQLRWRN